MVILVDTGVIKSACVVGAGIDSAFPILAKLIVRTFLLTAAAMQRVAFKLIFWQAHRFCLGAAIYHGIIACIYTLSLIAAVSFGGAFVRTDSAAGATVVGIAVMDVDADVLIILFTNRFLFILARG